ncbi:YbaN family protein [Marinobacter sp. 1_MG-2023]|uniref:YbaN family protein n=1 Tax=Marinobacter sp. 1_MG-2023 TaxID=3062627 RepID=UPI0026E23B39|nr:YbaN family protein [Marinobacter sp. 1_MG-2023]MDO6822813.1 YbaN family protein [Marinobacter sp. 1_MG-2023]
MAARSGKTSFRILAYISVAFAAIGVVLPLLPTTPFVLLAAFFASKGSPAFASWIEEHPSFGPAISDWRRNRVIPLKAKVLACSMMLLSWSSLVFMGAAGTILAISGIFMAGVASYLLTRPSY